VTERLIAKAHQALETAARDLEAGDADAAANRCDYAAFYAAWALFDSQGLAKPKTHSGLISEFGQRFVKTGVLARDLGSALGKLESLRSYADYTLGPTPREKVELAIDAARRFVSAIAQEIAKND
jgi:uncharacterized protein (UPF0332 family)